MSGLFKSRISGTGSYLPEGILTNYDIEKLVDTNHQWIVERTGIERRHIANEKQAASDLALEAAKKALAHASMTAQELDLIIVATVSGDQVMPSTGCVLQQKLGCRNIMAFDLTAACSGFVYSLSVADQFIKTGMYRNILVVGTEVLHHFVNYKDRETCILFGDGAGAWIVSRAEDNDSNVIMSSHLHADGNLGELFMLSAGGSRKPITADVIAKNEQYMTMKGREIFKNAVRTMTACCHEALDANNIKAEQVDWLVPHQANARILEAVADHFKFPKEKVIMSLHETGNTSAASIPLAFQHGIETGKIKRGDLILLAAFGAGLTSGRLLFRY